MKQINNLLDKEFKALIIWMLTELGKRIDEHSENFNKELENTPKEPVRAEEYNNWNEKHTRGIKSRLGDVEEHIRQTSGNHPISTAKTKTHLKKWG